jgi:hypothetical protein
VHDHVRLGLSHRPGDLLGIERVSHHRLDADVPKRRLL